MRRGRPVEVGPEQVDQPQSGLEHVVGSGLGFDAEKVEVPVVRNEDDVTGPRGVGDGRAEDAAIGFGQRVTPTTATAAALPTSSILLSARRRLGTVARQTMTVRVPACCGRPSMTIGSVASGQSVAGPDSSAERRIRAAPRRPPRHAGCPDSISHSAAPIKPDSAGDAVSTNVGRGTPRATSASSMATATELAPAPAWAPRTATFMAVVAGRGVGSRDVATCWRRTAATSSATATGDSTTAVLVTVHLGDP